jgi:hypothetical protein
MWRYFVAYCRIAPLQFYVQGNIVSTGWDVSSHVFFRPAKSSFSMFDLPVAKALILFLPSLFGLIRPQSFTLYHLKAEVESRQQK